MGDTAQGWRWPEPLTAAFSINKRDWNEALHPRGADGRWIDKLGFVKWKGLSGLWESGTVQSWDTRGGVTIKKSDGTSVIQPAKQLYSARQAVTKMPTKLTPAANPQGLRGSNPGGVMAEPSGDKWYVKTPKSAAHVANEIAGHKLYALAGVAVPTTAMSSDGKKFASKIEEAEAWGNLTGTDLDEAKAEIRKNFVVDAWLANWDAPANDNIRVNKDGTPLRVDTGGSLDYRARGGRRTLTMDVPELKTMRDPSISPSGSRLYAGLTRAEEEEAVKRILGVTPDAIREAIKDAGAPSRLADDMITRRAWLANNYGYQLPETTQAGKDALAAAKQDNKGGAAPNLTPLVRRSTSASPLAPNSPVWLKGKKKYGTTDDTWIIQSVSADKKTAQLKLKTGSTVLDNVDVADFELLRDNFASVNSKYSTGENVEIGDKVVTPKGDSAEVIDLFPMYAKVRIDGTNRSQVIATKRMSRTKGALPDAATSAPGTPTAATTPSAPAAPQNMDLYNNKYQDAWGKKQTIYRANAERYVRNGLSSKKSFDLKNVRPTQPEDTSKTDGSGSGAKDLDPIVAQINGELYLLDGHHRALNSNGTLDAHFVDFDSIKQDPSGDQFDFNSHDFVKTPHPKIYSLIHDKELALFKYDSATDKALVVMPDGLVGPMPKEKIRDVKTVDHDAWVAAKILAAAPAAPAKKKRGDGLTPIQRRQNKIDAMTVADTVNMKPQAVNIKYPAAGGAAQINIDPGMRAIKVENMIFTIDERNGDVRYAGRSTKAVNYSVDIPHDMRFDRDASTYLLMALSGANSSDIKEVTTPEGVKASQLLAESVGRKPANVDDIWNNAKFRLGNVTGDLPDGAREKLKADIDLKFVVHSVSTKSTQYANDKQPTILQIGGDTDAEFWFYGTGADPLDKPKKLTKEQVKYYFEANSSAYGSGVWYEVRNAVANTGATNLPSLDDSKLLQVGGLPLKNDDMTYQYGSSYVRNINAVSRRVHDATFRSSMDAGLEGSTRVEAPVARKAADAATNANNEALESGVIHKGFIFPRPKFKITPSEALTYKITASRKALNNGEYDDQFLEFSLSDRLRVGDDRKGQASDGTMHHDPMMYEFVQSHGGDAVAPRMSKSDFDQYLIDNAGVRELWRGVGAVNVGQHSGTSSDARNELQKGAHFAGKGYYGNGTYAAITKREAESYAGRGRGSSSGSVTRMTYRPDAKIGKMSEVVAEQMEEYGNQAGQIENGLTALGLMPKHSDDSSKLSDREKSDALQNYGLSSTTIEDFYDVKNLYIGYNLPSQHHDEYKKALGAERQFLMRRAVELADFYRSKGHSSISVTPKAGQDDNAVDVSMVDQNGDVKTVAFKSSFGTMEFLTAHYNRGGKTPKPYRTLAYKENSNSRGFGRSLDPSDPTSTATSSSSFGRTLTPQRVVSLAALADPTYDGLNPADEYKKSPDARSDKYKQMQALFKIAARMQYIQDPARFGFIAGYDAYTVEDYREYHIFTHRAPLIFQNGNP